MRLIKLAILSFLFLFIVITGISLFIPSHVRISRAINVKGAVSAVMAPIKDPGQWKNWYPGIDSMPLYYENGQVKGVYMDRFTKNVSLVITEEKSDELKAEFRSKMRPVINGWKAIPAPSGDSTTLQWYMDFNLRWYPWEKFTSLLFDKSYGPKMEKGLSNLQQLVR